MTELTASIRLRQESLRLCSYAKPASKNIPTPVVRGREYRRRPMRYAFPVQENIGTVRSTHPRVHSTLDLLEKVRPEAICSFNLGLSEISQFSASFRAHLVDRVLPASAYILARLAVVDGWASTDHTVSHNPVITAAGRIDKTECARATCACEAATNQTSHQPHQITKQGPMGPSRAVVVVQLAGGPLS